MRIGQYPFVPAEILDPSATGATVLYATGHNCSGTHEHEVLQQVTHPDGTIHEYVIMRGVSRAKAAAITMILNAPEAD
jgi:hypothetical protein